MHIDIHEQSKDSLAQLIKRAVAGEEIILDTNGKSIAKLIPLKQASKKKLRRGGQWKGKVKIAEDFDELPESFMVSFREEND